MDRNSHDRSIARAIRRSRAFRARIERRRRRKLLFSSGAALALVVGFEFALTSFGGMNIADAAVSNVKSLVDLLDQRSPGERTAGELIKTKHKREAPDQQELADVLTPPESALAPVDVDAAPATELAAAFPPAGEITGPPGGGGNVPPPGGGIVTPPHHGHTPPPPPSPPPPPPPALPEPGTWLTMIIGFGLVGWQLRRSRAAGQPRLSAQ